MSLLGLCPSCGRHVQVTEEACPFCAQRFDHAPEEQAGRGAKNAVRIAAVAVTAGLFAAGCPGVSADYGAPPVEDAGEFVDAGNDDGDDAGETDGG